MRFHIQQESDIPASTQLYNQICFAIAARHYPPGHRLPSTRQLAMQTGLHRNTISKVYRQLEVDGVVEAIAGSGIYVRDNLAQRELDLVLVSEKAKPPVCRIMDYGKYKFEQEKKAKEARKKSHQTEVKEVK